jgi:hypothetical protein
MDNRRRLSLRDCVVCIVVIGGHVVLLALLSRMSVQRLPASLSERALLLIELPPPERSEAPPPSPAKARLRTREAPARPTGSAITLPAPRDPAPWVDWQAEGERAARDAAARQAEPGPRAFGEQPVSRYRKCKPRDSSFEWDPEPDKAGFAGGLPFVRLGKRCVVGLGFFGCGIGKLPEANGELFAHMHSADEPESSVPTLEDCVP